MMTFEKAMSVILSLFFLTVICFLGLKNKDVFTQSMKAVLQETDTEQAKSEEKLKSELSSVETSIKENFLYKNEAADIYGLGLMALNKRIVGNSEYIKTTDGLTVRFPGKYSIEPFYDDIVKLSTFLKEKDIPLIYIDVPNYNMNEKESAVCGYAEHRKTLTELFDKIEAAGIDTLDLNAKITDITPYFKTDGHFRTEYEFQIAQNICNKLINQYNIDIPEYAKVFDLNNYDIKTYPFIGGTARNSGRFFSGVDDFQIFHPKFETSMRLFVYDNGKKRTGIYDEVCLNGYEKNEDIDEYTYWVINFLQYPRAQYEVSNNTVNGPKLLIIADSCMLRSMTFLSLASSNITVMDPRTANHSIINNVLNCDYDAVVVAGISYQFYASNLFCNAVDDISGLRVNAMKKPVGYYGMYLGQCNGERPEKQGEIEIDPSASTITFSGWAVDSDNKNSLKSFYIKAGNKILTTNFGQELANMVDYFNEPNYLISGFDVTFNSELLYDDSGELLESIYFILVEHDGTYMYEPVEYKLH